MLNNLIQFLNYRGSIILTKQKQGEHSKHHNKKRITKNKTKGIKNQIKDLLATYRMLSKGLNQVKIIPKKITLISILIGINQHEIN